MTRDIIADIKENDIVLSGNIDKQSVFYNVIWGKILDTDDESHLYANIVIPVKYLNTIKYDEETLQYVCLATIPYCPISQNFNIRLVTESGGEYQLINGQETAVPNNMPAYSYAFNRILPQKLNASQLPVINIDGNFLICIQKSQNENFNRAYIYSADETDFEIGFSDDQAAQLLAICAAGKYYRYPTTGIGITDYINSVVSHTQLGSSISEQFKRNTMPVQNASFDAETGDLKVIFSNEPEPSPDKNLTDKDKLDLDLLHIADDDFIRRMQPVDSEIDDSEYLNNVMKYDMLFNLFFFYDSTSVMTRLADSLENGIIKPDGSIAGGGGGELIISARIRANSVIAFELPEYNYSTHPSFIIENSDTGDMMYKSLVGESYGRRENCKKCGVSMVDCTIRYGVSKEDFENGAGLYLVAQTAENWKNLLSVVTDNVTGRLLGIITSSSNIVDAVLDTNTNNLLVIKQNID